MDRAPVDATIAISGTTPKVVQPADGRTLDRRGAASAITGALAAGRNPKAPIALPVKVAHVHVGAAAAQRVLDSTVTPALAAPITIAATQGGTSAEVPVSAIAASLKFTPKADGKLAVSVDPAALQKSLGDRLTDSVRSNTKSGPNGNDMNAAKTGANARYGARKNKIWSARPGSKSSLLASLMPSAKDCSSPSGPTRFGPCRC